MMVFALHFGAGSHGAVLKLVKAISLRGGMGVDLFFVLSGFLITGILYDTQSDSHYFLRFFGRRSIRIFPIFYSVLAILSVLTPALAYQWRLGYPCVPFSMLGTSLWRSIPRLKVIGSAIHPTASAQLVHFWSLCVEEQFYLLWPFVVWSVRDRIRPTIWVAGGLSVAALAFRVAFILNFSAQYYEDWMQHMLPFRMDALLIGAILALVMRGPRADLWQRSGKWLFMISTVAVLVITVHSPSSSSRWYNTVGSSTVALASAGLIGDTLRRDSIAYRFFHLRPLRILGKYSYGFYVYHLIWAEAWSHLEQTLAVRLHSSVLATAIVDVVSFALTFVVAKLSYDYFEIRFLRWKKSFEYDSEQTSHRHAFSLH